MITTAQGDRFADRLAEIQARLGNHVPLGDLGNVVQALMVSAEGDINAVNLSLQRQLDELLDYMQTVRREISAIQPASISEHDISAVTDELDAIVVTAERATDQILDVAEQLTVLSEDLTPEQAETLSVLSNQIFEASNFQDLTGQRISKVVRLVRNIEEKIRQMADAIGGDSAGGAWIANTGPVEAAGGDELLLNGPALPDEANSQDDIDALLADFD